MDKKPMQRDVQELISGIKQKTIDPKTLTRAEVDLCIEHLHCELSEQQYHVASFLQVHRNTVSTRVKRILKRRALELRERGIDSYEVAVRCKWVADLTMYRALREGDTRLFNDAFHRYVSQLQDLGVVYKAPAQVEMHTYNEEKWDALENLVIQVLESYPGAKEELVLRLEKQRSYNGSGNGHDS